MPKTENSNHGSVPFNLWIGPLLGATTLGKSRPRSIGSERLLPIPQSSCLTGKSPTDCLVSYPRHALWEVLPLSTDAIGVFYSPSLLGKLCLDMSHRPQLIYGSCCFLMVAHPSLHPANRCLTLVIKRKSVAFSVIWSLFNTVSLFLVTKSNVGDLSRGWPKGSLFNIYFAEV